MSCLPVELFTAFMALRGGISGSFPTRGVLVMEHHTKGGLAGFINNLEETAIALLLGGMTILTFANVVARYVFNSNILWALETTEFLFAWLVLFGISYCVKIGAHLGVDTLVNLFAPPVRKAITLLALVGCLVYTGLLLKGGWDYWWKFASNLAFLEVEDVPFPVFLQEVLGFIDEGEPVYEKIPRYIPYFILPFGLALMLFRFLEAGYEVLTDKRTLLIASHEAEDMMEDVAAENKEKDA